MKSIVYWFKLHWNFSQGSSQQHGSIDSDNELALIFLGDRPLYIYEPIIAYLDDAYASFGLSELTHWSLSKMADILQTTISNSITWLKIYVFYSNFTEARSQWYNWR